MIVFCKQCKSEFTTFPSRIKRGAGQFCNKNCYDIFQTGIPQKKKPRLQTDNDFDIGKKYGRLLITARAHINKFYVKHVVAICECSVTKTYPLNQLRMGATISCGCYQKEHCGQILAKAKTTHGKSNEPEYAAWSGIIQRCYNPKTPSYKDYGGRGIKMCDRWRHSFENFYLDMGKKTSKLHSVDRYPDKNGDYEPINCRWATDVEQARNRRSNKLVNFNGAELILKDFCILIGQPPQTVGKYLKDHSPEETVNHYVKNSQCLI